VLQPPRSLPFPRLRHNHYLLCSEALIPFAFFVASALSLAATVLRDGRGCLPPFQGLLVMPSIFSTPQRQTESQNVCSISHLADHPLFLFAPTEIFLLHSQQDIFSLIDHGSPPPFAKRAPRGGCSCGLSSFFHLQNPFSRFPFLRTLPPPLTILSNLLCPILTLFMKPMGTHGLIVSSTPPPTPRFYHDTPGFTPPGLGLFFGQQLRQLENGFPFSRNDPLGCLNFSFFFPCPGSRIQVFFPTGLFKSLWVTRNRYPLFFTFPILGIGVNPPKRPWDWR